MRKLFFILAGLSIVLFLYSVTRLFPSYSKMSVQSVQVIHGFEDNSASDEYNRLVAKFHQKISGHNELADRNQSRYFWLNFLVTALTAASTLVSSIQAAKRDTPNPTTSRTFVIVTAVLAFCSALSNFASTHYNDLKTEETKKATDLSTRRNQFFVDYSKAPDSLKSSVIRSYADQMD